MLLSLVDGQSRTGTWGAFLYGSQSESALGAVIKFLSARDVFTGRYLQTAFNILFPA